MSGITIDQITAHLLTSFQGIREKRTWGERSFFYNPDGSSPHGTYFVTIKEKNGDNDKASALDRPGIYRVNFGVGKMTFTSLFGSIPARPAKGGIIAGGYDFQRLNHLTPHPIYGWMCWVALICPDETMFETIKPLLRESHGLAAEKFAKRK